MKLITEDNGFIIVNLPAEISNQDIDECSKLTETLDAIQLKENLKIIVDFANVKYVASQALVILLDFNNKISTLDGRMVFSNVNGYILNVLNILGFQTIIDIFEDVEKAKESF